MSGHPAEYLTYAEVLAYVGFSDSEIDIFSEHYETLEESYGDQQFRTVCLENRFYLTRNGTLTKYTPEGYLDISPASDGLFSMSMAEDNVVF